MSASTSPKSTSRRRASIDRARTGDGDRPCALHRGRADSTRSGPGGHPGAEPGGRGARRPNLVESGRSVRPQYRAAPARARVRTRWPGALHAERQAGDRARLAADSHPLVQPAKLVAEVARRRRTGPCRARSRRHDDGRGGPRRTAMSSSSRAAMPSARSVTVERTIPCVLGGGRDPEISKDRAGGRDRPGRRGRPPRGHARPTPARRQALARPETMRHRARTPVRGRDERQRPRRAAPDRVAVSRPRAARMNDLLIARHPG